MSSSEDEEQPPRKKADISSLFRDSDFDSFSDADDETDEEDSAADECYTETVKSAAIMIRYMLSKSTDEEMKLFERANLRLGFHYSPFSARAARTSDTKSLFRDNCDRNSIPGRRHMILMKFRTDLLDNRWLELLQTAKEFLKMNYNNAKFFIRSFCSVIIPPLLLSLCMPLTDENCGKLQTIFKDLSNMPRSNYRKIQLDLARLLLASGQSVNDAILPVLRLQLRTTRRITTKVLAPEAPINQFSSKMQVRHEYDIYAMEAVLTSVFSRYRNQPAKIGQILSTCEHWAAAFAVWKANQGDDPDVIDQIRNAMFQGHSEHSCCVVAPSCCRLRYALALADELTLKQYEEKEVDGEDIANQVEDLMITSPGDDLLVFHLETRDLTAKKSIALVFSLLDAPDAAMKSRLWSKLVRYLELAEHGDQVMAKEIEIQWSERKDWWPYYIEELNLPHEIAQHFLSQISKFQF